VFDRWVFANVDWDILDLLVSKLCVLMDQPHRAPSLLQEKPLRVRVMVVVCHLDSSRCILTIAIISEERWVIVTFVRFHA
jgi:hypothetical protein